MDCTAEWYKLSNIQIIAFAASYFFNCSTYLLVFSLMTPLTEAQTERMEEFMDLMEKRFEKVEAATQKV